MGGWVWSVHGAQQCSTEIGGCWISFVLPGTVYCLYNRFSSHRPTRITSLCLAQLHQHQSLVCVLFSLSTEDRRKQGNREEVGKTKNYRSWIPKKPPLRSKFSNYKTPWGPTESREAERREGATAKYYRSVALLHISFKHTVFKNECILRLYFKINDRTCFFNSWTASFSWKLDLFLRYLKLCD